MKEELKKFGTDNGSFDYLVCKIHKLVNDLRYENNQLVKDIYLDGINVFLAECIKRYDKLESRVMDLENMSSDFYSYKDWKTYNDVVEDISKLEGDD